MQNTENNFVPKPSAPEEHPQSEEAPVRYIYVPAIQGAMPGMESLMMPGAKTKRIDYARLFRAVKKNVVYIILCAMIAGALGFVYTLMFFTPQYESNVSMYINGASVSVGGTSVNISSFSAELTTGLLMKSTFSFVLNSRTTLNEIIDEAGLPYTYSQLSGKLRAESVPDTAALIIYATSIDPYESELIANTTAEVLQRRITDVVEGCSVKIVDYAVVPTSRDSANYTQNTIIGILLGMISSTAVIVAFAWLMDKKNTSIRSSDDFKEKYPDIPILGAIPDMSVKIKGKYYDYNYAYSSDGRSDGKTDTNTK